MNRGSAPATRRGRALPRRLRDDRGSLPMLMMVVLVGMVLSSLMVSILVSQTRATRFTASRDEALDAAQSGVDVVLARIRATADASGTGALAGLPCWTQGTPYTGSVVGDGSGTQTGSASYTVYVDYYLVDPVRDAGAAAMICAPGYGTYDPASGQSTPNFALITSTGSVAPRPGTTPDRTLASTYVFKVSNTNVAGGIVRLYPSVGASTNVCLDAGTPSPDPDSTSPLFLQVCSTTTPPLAQQVFAYRSDLTILLVSSVTAANPDGMCVDSVAPLANGSSVYLKKCRALGSPPYQQQWSFDDNGHLRGSLVSSSSAPGTLSNICIAAASQSPGQAVKSATCAGSVSDPAQAWIPAPSVGAGAAGDPQYVNFREFGRCMDVTNQDVNATHFIDYPCKQNPYPGAVAWNQRFTYTPLTGTYGQLTTSTGGTTYCITSTDVAGGYPTLKPCTTSGTTTAQRQRWIRNGDNTALAYSAKFNFVDFAGSCLGLTDPVGTEVWSAVDVETCDGSMEQKWNATPNLSGTALQNTIEK